MEDIVNPIKWLYLYKEKKNETTQFKVRTNSRALSVSLNYQFCGSGSKKLQKLGFPSFIGIITKFLDIFQCLVVRVGVCVLYTTQHGSNMAFISLFSKIKFGFIQSATKSAKINKFLGQNHLNT